MKSNPAKSIDSKMYPCLKSQTRVFYKRDIFAWLIAGLFIFWPLYGMAGNHQIKQRDVNKDGIMDQVATFDDQGRLVILALDDNGDGVMDTFQYYVDDMVVRLEKNLDSESGIDMRVFFKDGIKVRQERLDKDGKVFQDMDLDATGEPIQIREDTTADQRMDTVYYFIKGEITRITRDPDGNGTTDTLELYQRGRLVESRMDENGDGTMDVHLLFDDHGQVLRRHLDTDQDGDLDLLEIYRNGLVEAQQWDHNQDKRYERVVFFEKGDIVRMEEDTDMNGSRETLVVYRGGKPFVQTVDANQDAKEELRIFFNTGGETERIEKDVSLDGNMDTFQHYKNNRLSYVEKDSNADGEIDTKIWYEMGKQKTSLGDLDHDGRFETTHSYDRAPWTRVTEQGSDGSGNVDVRSYFLHDILRRRDTLNKDANLVEYRENFDETGLLVNSREDRNADGRWDMTWYYDGQGNFERAEKDTDEDGRVDTWYLYKGERLSRVSQDTNGDAQPDVWEDYDASERMVQREKDLDFDGVADIEERF